MRIVVLASALLFSSTLAVQEPGDPHSDRLEDMVGAWQTDTVGGTSAHFTCERSPEDRALICDESISHPGGVEHVLGVYSPDSLPDRYVYIEVSARGAPLVPTRLLIADHVWIFGGDRLASDGSYHRTLHDFTAPTGTFFWRKESSRDGVHWTLERGGTGHRRRPLVPASHVRD